MSGMRRFPIENAGNGFLKRKVEAAGIEPASAVAPNRASTSVVHA
jgi:hypothetical protein